MNKEVAEVAGKLLVAIVFGFVIRPLAIIYGLNIMLESINVSTLPYTLLVYFGVLVVLLAIKVEVKNND